MMGGWLGFGRRHLAVLAVDVPCSLGRALAVDQQRTCELACARRLLWGVGELVVRLIRCHALLKLWSSLVAGSAAALKVRRVLRGDLWLAHLVMLYRWLRGPGLDVGSIRYMVVARVLIELVILERSVWLPLVVNEAQHLTPLYRTANC